VLEAADGLEFMPERGRIVPELSHPELREVFIQRYRLIYRVKGDVVELIAMVHGARDVQAMLGDD
jgi:plasmid stabilization system protein ParE